LVSKDLQLLLNYHSEKGGKKPRGNLILLSYEAPAFGRGGVGGKKKKKVMAKLLQTC